MKYRNLSTTLNQFLSALCGVVIVRQTTILDLREGNSKVDRSSFDLEFLTTFPPEQSGRILPLLKDSRSQLRQDIFVLLQLNFKTDGYFVEFGATNGIDLSNTFLLETEFGWKGILVEPARVWHKELRQNRQLAVIEEDCVWSISNENIAFRETALPELSTIAKLEVNDEHNLQRESGKVYKVRSISLNDLLLKNSSPNHIDYLSIDTEGSEYEILKNLDFQKYSFNVITCEHNYTENREKIHALLTANGYIRKYINLSRFDDWYVRDSGCNS